MAHETWPVKASFRRVRCADHAELTREAVLRGAKSRRRLSLAALALLGVASGGCSLIGYGAAMKGYRDETGKYHYDNEQGALEKQGQLISELFMNGLLPRSMGISAPR
jgi:hypothetical protein